MKKEYKLAIIALSIGIIYVFYFWIGVAISVKYDWLVSLGDLNYTTLLNKFINDSVIMLILPVGVLLANRNDLDSINVRIRNSGLCIFLTMLYVLFFILHKDYSIGGYYKAFFYLIMVATAEELTFRGYLYGRLKLIGRKRAIILSGIIFGMIHAILPGVVEDRSIVDTLFGMINHIGGGILSTYMFVLLMELGGTIFIPILIHALLDYSYNLWGLVVLVIIFIYLLVQKKKRNTNDAGILTTET